MLRSPMRSSRRQPCASWPFPVVWAVAVAATVVMVVAAVVAAEPLTLIPGEAQFAQVCGALEPGSILHTYVQRHRRAVNWLRSSSGGDGGGSGDRATSEEGDGGWPAVDDGTDGWSPDGVGGPNWQPKFLIWRCRDKKHVGGIGDRLKLFGLIMTTVLATRRVLLIDWTDFSDVFEPRWFEWRMQELESMLRRRSGGGVWWEFEGEHEEDERVSAELRRPFSNISHAAAVEVVAGEPGWWASGSGASAAGATDFEDMVRDLAALGATLLPCSSERL
jgi:hypothetical protein